jgi:hypothetical protein
VLAFQPTSTECACGVSPVPESGMEIIAAPLLESVRLPETVPGALGENITGRFTLCAGLSVMGVVAPVLKPEPLMLSCVIVAAAFPLFEIFTVSVTGVLRTSDPKPRLLGVAVRTAEFGVGVGVGLGFCPGAPLALCTPPPPPHPITLKQTKAEMKTKEQSLLANLVLRNGDS